MRPRGTEYSRAKSVTHKPLTLWQTLQRTPPFVCLAMAVKRNRKGVVRRSIDELAQRSGIKRRTLQALAYRREWPHLIKTVSDFAEACGVNLLARDPRRQYRKLVNGGIAHLTPKQRASMVRLAKESKKAA